MPSSPLRMLLLVATAAFLVAFVQLGVLAAAFDKLGLSPHSASLLLMTTLAGSLINLPLFSLKADSSVPSSLPTQTWPWRRIPRMPFAGRTVVAINVGGGVTPVAFSLYLLAQNPMNPFQVLLAIAMVAAVAYLFSRPVAGIGIGMPIMVAPVTAALVAVSLNPEQSAPLAYIGGTLGVLIGADLLRLKDIRELGAPMASIGGAGTFDGIFVTGIVAVLLA
jgi:uncharacterized membrane protein